MARKLIVEVVGDVSNFVTNLGKASSEARGFGTNVGRIGGSVSESLGKAETSARGFGTSMGRLSSVVAGSLGKAGASAKEFEGDLSRVGGTVEKMARAQVAAATKVDARLREQVVAFRQIAAAAERGSREQVTAANLAARAQQQLSRSMGVTEREARSLSSQTDRATRSLSGFARGGVAGSGALRGLGRQIAFASGSFLGGAGVVAGLKATSSAASNLAEQMSKTQQVFGQATPVVQSFAKNALGLAQDRALETASSLGALLRPMGILPDKAAALSVQLTNLGVDFASFFNTDVVDALDAIRSGIVGESEPLRRYGVLLSEARVQQEALKETGKTHAKSLTVQEKALARVALILRDSTQAQGDYARTLGGLANQQREFEKNVRNLEIAVGQALNPAILEVTRNLNAWFSNEQNVARVQRDVQQAVSTSVAVVRDFATAVDTVADAVGGFKVALELLIGLKVASVLAGWATALRGIAVANAAVASTNVVSTLSTTAASMTTISANAGKASAAVTLLRTRLAGLSTFGAIVIPITVAIAAHEVASKIAALQQQVIGAQQRLAARGSGVRVTLIPDLANEIKRLRAQGETVAQILAQLRKRLGGSQLADEIIADAFHLSAGASDKQSKALRKEIADAAKNALGGAADEIANSPAAKKIKKVTAEQRNQFFDAMIGRRESRVQDIASLSGQVEELGRIAALIEARIGKTKDITRKLALEDQLLGVQRQAKAARQQIAQDLVDRFQLGIDSAALTAGLGDDLRALDALRAHLQNRLASERGNIDLQRQLVQVQSQMASVRTQMGQDVLDALSLKLTKAEATKGLNDDLAVLAEQQAALRKRIKVEGATLDLQTQLFDVQQQIKAKGLEKRATAQFGALGLGPTGQDLAPTAAAIRNNIQVVQKALAQAGELSPANRAKLANIRKVLSGQFGAVGDDVREKMKSILDDLFSSIDSIGDRVASAARKARNQLDIVGRTEPMPGLGQSTRQPSENELAKLNRVLERLTGRPQLETPEAAQLRRDQDRLGDVLRRGQPLVPDKRRFFDEQQGDQLNKSLGNLTTALQTNTKALKLPPLVHDDPKLSTDKRRFFAPLSPLATPTARAPAAAPAAGGDTFVYSPTINSPDLADADKLARSGFFRARQVLRTRRR